MRAAIVGAGVAGLNLARRLSEQGVDVQLFEKARGPSGRLSTRRTEAGQFDHGAQYLTARDPVFRAQVDDWLARGIVAQWNGRFVRLRPGGSDPVEDETERFVGQPRMSAIARDLLGDLPIEIGVRMESARKTTKGWLLRSDAGFEYPDFDVLMLAVPAPQALPFLDASPLLRAEAGLIQMLPCHAVMATFSEPPDVDFDGAFVDGSEVSWVARNSSKPGRGPEACWLLHSAAEWSASNLDLEPTDVRDTLLRGFEHALGRPLPPVEFSATHRWLYARAPVPPEGRTVWDRVEKIGICGDWVRGDRVEDAFLSAERLATEFALSSGGR